MVVSDRWWCLKVCTRGLVLAGTGEVYSKAGGGGVMKSMRVENDEKWRDWAGAVFLARPLSQ